MQEVVNMMKAGKENLWGCQPSFVSGQISFHVATMLKMPRSQYLDSFFFRRKKAEKVMKF